MSEGRKPTMHTVDLLCYAVALVLFVLAAIPRMPMKAVLIAAGLAFVTFPRFLSTVQS